MGAEVERLSLLRISNFNAAFNLMILKNLWKNQLIIPYMIFVGRLDEINLPFDALAAFDLAAPHLPEYRLVMVGDGAMRQQVEQMKKAQ